MRCPFCGRNLGSMSTGQRVDHREKCEDIRNGKIFPLKKSI